MASKNRKIVLGSSDIPDLEKYIFNFEKIFFERYQKYFDNKNPEGLNSLFKEFFPLFIGGREKKKEGGNKKIVYEKFELGQAFYSPEECKKRKTTYSAPLKIFLRLFEDDVEIDSSWVFLCNVPLMTNKAKFIINGNSKIMIGQFQKIPGAFFDVELNNDKLLESVVTKLIPSYGSWLSIYLSKNNKLYVTVDNKTKISFTTFLLCFPKEDSEEMENFRDTDKLLDFNLCPGYTLSEIFDMFYEKILIKKSGNLWELEFFILNHKNLLFDIYDKNENLLFKKNQIINDEIKSLVGRKIYINDLKGFFFAENAGDKYKIGDPVTIIKNKDEYLVYKTDKDSVILNSTDGITTRSKALEEYLESIKSKDTRISRAHISFNNRFFSSKHYSLRQEGKYRLELLFEDYEYKKKHLTLEINDLIVIAKKMIKGNIFITKDHLSFRRLRLAHDLFGVYFREALSAVQRNISKIKLNLNTSTFSWLDFFNSKDFTNAIKALFYISELCQMATDINRPNEVAQFNKCGYKGLFGKHISMDLRRLSDGREGRLDAQCSDGKEVGINSYLTAFCHINDFGEILAYLKPVKDGEIQDEILALTAYQTINCNIADPIGFKNIPKDQYVYALKDSQWVYVKKTQIHYVFLTPKQLFSCATNLIPGLQHNDTTRAVIAANMQHQAMELANPSLPVLSTGMESLLSDNVRAEQDGKVISIDNKRVIILNNNKTVSIYHLKNYESTNHQTCINYKTRLKIGDFVKANEKIIDGFSTFNGELSLGANCIVVQTTHSHTFQDAIVFSEEAAKKFSSCLIHKFSVEIIKNSGGLACNTNDIPMVSTIQTSHLNRDGIPQIGHYIKRGDILIGIVSPAKIGQAKEQDLVAQLIGEMRATYVNDSLYSTVSGFVKSIQVLHSSEYINSKDDSTKELEAFEVEKIYRDFNDTRSILIEVLKNKLKDEEIALIEKYSLIKTCLSFFFKTEESLDKFIKNESISNFFIMSKEQKSIVDLTIFIENKTFEEQATDEQKAMMENLKKVFRKKEDLDSFIQKCLNLFLPDDFVNFFKEKKSFSKLRKDYEEIINKNKNNSEVINNIFDKINELAIQTQKNVSNIIEGFDLPEGVIKMIFVEIIEYLPAVVGDKFSNRYGGKGVISKILSSEDMYFLEDGRPVDIIFSPLGVLSRMNCSQIIEVVFGNFSMLMEQRLKDLLVKYFIKHKLEKITQEKKNIIINQLKISVDNDKKWTEDLYNMEEKLLEKKSYYKKIKNLIKDDALFQEFEDLNKKKLEEKRIFIEKIRTILEKKLENQKNSFLLRINNFMEEVFTDEEMSYLLDHLKKIDFNTNDKELFLREKENIHLKIDDIFNEIKTNLELVLRKKIDNKDVLDTAIDMVENHIRFEIHSFSDFKYENIQELLEEAGFNKNAKIPIYNGKTGEKLLGTSLCGYKFMYKLIHVILTKYSARATGKNALITGKPISGGQTSGQAIGHMEQTAKRANGQAFSMLWDLFVCNNKKEGARIRDYLIRHGKLISYLFEPKKVKLFNNTEHLLAFLRALHIDVEFYLGDKKVPLEKAFMGQFKQNYIGVNQ